MKAKKPATYLVRVPSWSKRDDVRAYRDGRVIRPEWGGPGLAYVEFPAARTGEELTVSYPLAEFSQRIDFAFAERPDLKFELGWVGNSVVAISPQATQLPLPTATPA